MEKVTFFLEKCLYESLNGYILSEETTNVWICEKVKLFKRKKQEFFLFIYNSVIKQHILKVRTFKNRISLEDLLFNPAVLATDRCQKLQQNLRRFRLSSSRFTTAIHLLISSAWPYRDFWVNNILEEHMHSVLLFTVYNAFKALFLSICCILHKPSLAVWEMISQLF